MQHGFTLLRDEYHQEIGGTARLWQHEKTGAQLLSITNSDENKCFGVNFRTPPEDSTGLPHILEHSVLCGSDKYPVKEPFVELLKGSLQTFLNAMTYPDKTCYPVASANLQDFYNLVDVYLDAVFHPRITENVLRQEGWHITAENADAPFQYQGVVFNEMKGVYSSPESVLAQASQASLFPDTSYSLESGGLPEDIPNLTFAAFKQFHEKYYHPTNALFFFWGDDPEERRLERLEQELASYQRGADRPEIALQKRLETPRLLEIPYAASPEEDRSFVSCNWLLCETSDIDQLMALRVLEHILLGLPGSPLRKALIESGLGEDITGVGLETDMRQIWFSVGLSGIAPENRNSVEMCIMECLADLAEEGVSPQAIEAAMNSAEFSLRENNTGRTPRGLSAMLRSLMTWLYDGDPLATLAYEAPLARLKKRLAAHEAVFEQLIQHSLLQNEHRSVVMLIPDAKLAARKEAEENARLEKVRAALNPTERLELVQYAADLRKAQETSDSPEALASIPALTLADLPPKITLLPNEERRAGSVPAFFHNLDTSGIVYASILLPLDAVPEQLFPLLPLYTQALTEMGTQKHGYVDLGMEIAAKTGGLEADTLFMATLFDKTPRTWLKISGKATSEKIPDLFALMDEITQPSFDDADRFSQMVLERKARMEQSLVPYGNSIVGARLRARYHQADWFDELTDGVQGLHDARALAERVQSDWPSIKTDLQKLNALIMHGSQAICNLTTDARHADQALMLAGQLCARLPQDILPPATWCSTPSSIQFPAAEALITPAHVNYVGQSANIYDLGFQFHGAAAVVFRHLRMGYLWDKVRVQGGAYGAQCSLSRSTGTLLAVSYRDPHVERTLEAYSGMASYLRHLQLDSRELSQAIIGAIGDMDAYMLPAAKGATAFAHQLSGYTDEMRQKTRDEILGTTLSDFKKHADMLDAFAQKGALCILGGNSAEQIAQKRGWEIVSLL